MFESVTQLLPSNVRSNLYELIDYAKIKTDKRKFIAFVLVFSFLFSIFLALIIALFSNGGFLLTYIISQITIVVGSYFVISLKADSIAKFVEGVLPDALQLMASNLRAGLTTDRALILAARPEFGVLSEEINKIGKKITLGGDISVALMAMSSSFKSDRLKKTLLLIVTGLRSGGELTDLLDQTAANLRKERFLDEKIRTNVLMYVIFIFAAIGFGAPLLFGLSSFLVGVLQENLALVELPKETSLSLPISFSEVQIEPSFVLMFSIITLISTAILGSFALGLISKGREKYGIRFMPILLILSMTVFFLVRYLIRNLLGGLFGLGG